MNLGLLLAALLGFIGSVQDGRGRLQLETFGTTGTPELTRYRYSPRGLVEWPGGAGWGWYGRSGTLQL